MKERLEGYVEAAIDAFVEEYGRMPETDADIAEAEAMADVPEAYRTNGDPISQEDLIERILQSGSPVGSGQLAEGSESGAGTVSDPPGGTGDYAERRSNLAAEIEDWYGRAYDAFVQKQGREPVSVNDVIEAETLAGVPEKYCTGGDDVQALVVADKVLWDTDNQLAVGSGQLAEDRELANVWSDEARRAALAVRRMKGAARKDFNAEARRRGGVEVGGENEQARTPIPPGGDGVHKRARTPIPPKGEYNPHYPVYRPPVILPTPGSAYQPIVDAEGRKSRTRIPQGKPVPIHRIFGK